MNGAGRCDCGARQYCLGGGDEVTRILHPGSQGGPVDQVTQWGGCRLWGGRELRGEARRKARRSISRTEKRGRGRPPTGAESIHLRRLPLQLSAVDEWARSQKDRPSRPKAVRRLIELSLAATKPTTKNNRKAKAKARDLAGEQLDELINPSAPHEEQRLARPLDHVVGARE
jgi:hypothetical protein